MRDRPPRPKRRPGLTPREIQAIEAAGALEHAWHAIRDAEVASGSQRVKKIMADPKRAGLWRKRVLGDLRALLRNPRGLAADGTSLTPEGLRVWRERKQVIDDEKRRQKMAREAVRIAGVARRTALAKANRERKAAILREEEARLAVLRKAAPHLPASPKPPPPRDVVRDAVVCPHGMDRSVCAYCSAARR
jgi:hypothetical protein